MANALDGSMRTFPSQSRVMKRKVASTVVSSTVSGSRYLSAMRGQ
jgi:hypothetical protein